MESIEYKTVDKAGWPRGPWDLEPDKVQWTDPETGIVCLAVRHRTAGHWCGYAGVAPDHPWHGKDYGQCPRECGAESWCEHSPGSILNCHGGVTFADKCGPGAESESVCHRAAPGEPDDVWWFGFDCAHCDDFSPGRPAYSIEQYRYRTLEYVKGHCAKMAKQLKDATWVSSVAG